MILQEWLNANPNVGVYCPQQSPYFKIMPGCNAQYDGTCVAMVYSSNPELWHLDDYRVSSHAGGGLVVLVPVPVDKPKQEA